MQEYEYLSGGEILSDLDRVRVRGHAVEEVNASRTSLLVVLEETRWAAIR